MEPPNQRIYEGYVGGRKDYAEDLAIYREKKLKIARNEKADARAAKSRSGIEKHHAIVKKRAREKNIRTAAAFSRDDLNFGFNSGKVATKKPYEYGGKQDQALYSRKGEIGKKLQRMSKTKDIGAIGEPEIVRRKYTRVDRGRKDVEKIEKMANMTPYQKRQKTKEKYADSLANKSRNIREPLGWDKTRYKAALSTLTLKQLRELANLEEHGSTKESRDYFQISYGLRKQKRLERDAAYYMKRSARHTKPGR